MKPVSICEPGRKLPCRNREAALIAADQVGEVANIEKSVMGLQQQTPQNGTQFSDIAGPVIAQKRSMSAWEQRILSKGEALRRNASAMARMSSTRSRRAGTRMRSSMSGKIGMQGEWRMERGAAGHQKLNSLAARPAEVVIEGMSQTCLGFERKRLGVQQQQSTAHGETELAEMEVA